MNVAALQTMSVEGRAVQRDQVHLRTRGTLDNGRPVPLLVVDLSTRGMMARVDTDVSAGDRLSVTLPHAGIVAAEVRWSLGGRIGCQFANDIDPRLYSMLLRQVIASN